MRGFARFVFFCTQRTRITGLENIPRSGGFILASNHEGHVDPYCISAQTDRIIFWMARVEFFQSRFWRWFMSQSLAFPVNRRGIPVRAIRTALRLLDQGQVVGIFPEGEVMTGAVSVLAGGPIRRGACLLARRSGLPVVPCVIRGTRPLRHIGPWLPARRGRFEVHFGEPFYADGSGLRRARDEAMARELSARLRTLAERCSPDLPV